MAPAIAHFLVGSSLLLVLVTPLALQYGFDRENVIWLVPIGGVYGLLPDIHHIMPLYSAELYALHNTPWVDLFAFHYTLDRPAIRARYYESVFGSIVVSFASVAMFWRSIHVRRVHVTTRGLLDRLTISLATAIGPTAYATVALWVVVSIQAGFPTVAALVGADSVLVGGLLLLPLGLGLGMLYTIGLESLAALGYATTTPLAAGIGCLFGVVSWIGGVVLASPVWLQFVTNVSLSIPFVHWGSLGALVVYGTVFGVVYGLLKSAFSPVIAS